MHVLGDIYGIDNRIREVHDPDMRVRWDPEHRCYVVERQGKELRMEGRLAGGAPLLSLHDVWTFVQTWPWPLDIRLLHHLRETDTWRFARIEDAYHEQQERIDRELASRERAQENALESATREYAPHIAAERGGWTRPYHTRFAGFTPGGEH